MSEVRFPDPSFFKYHGHNCVTTEGSCTCATHNEERRRADRLEAEKAALKTRVSSLEEVGNWMAECLEDHTVNLAEWEHSPSEDALDAWRALATPMLRREGE
jgi:hypothetical protein